MTKYIFSFCMILIAFGCQPEKKADTTTSSSSLRDNQLTAAQQEQGWKLLFNGENLSGWRIFKSKENNSWEVVNGTLHCKATDLANKRSDIMTVDQYDNFELTFDWKISYQGNSGVMFRVTEENDEPYYSGPEYQVIDDKNYPEPLKDAHRTASNYDMHPAPASKPMKPAGEWNSSKIIVNGNHVEHWLNNTKVLEYELHSPEWKKMKAESKWKDVAEYGASPSGYIDFQDHGSEVWYKNIFIREL